jgi:hypothetical protein
MWRDMSESPPALQDVAKAARGEEQVIASKTGRRPIFSAFIREG